MSDFARTACACSECERLRFVAERDAALLRAAEDEADRTRNTRDAGAERDMRPPKPCLARIGPGQWCQLDAGHPARVAHATSAAPAVYEEPALAVRRKP